LFRKRKSFLSKTPGAECPFFVRFLGFSKRPVKVVSYSTWVLASEISIWNRNNPNDFIFCGTRLKKILINSTRRLKTEKIIAFSEWY